MVLTALWYSTSSISTSSTTFEIVFLPSHHHRDKDEEERKRLERERIEKEKRRREEARLRNRQRGIKTYKVCSSSPLTFKCSPDTTQ